MPNKKLSPSEALYGFIAWLTTRKEILTLGSSKDCAPFPPLIAKFCEVNGLEEPRPGWDLALKHVEEDDNGEFKEAFKVFAKGLRKDSELFRSYKANIAMAFYDEYRRTGDKLPHKTVREVANRAAENFLYLLLS